MLGQLSRKAVQLPGEFDQLLPRGVGQFVLKVRQQTHLLSQGDAVAFLHPLCQFVHLVGRQAQGLPQVPHRAADSVGLDHSCKRRPLPPVLLMHP